MTTVQPFLFRFKRECLSPRRVVPDERFYYDQDTCQIMTTENGRPIPAIESPDTEGLMTKKADIEKGEDQKDRQIWW